MLTSHRVGKNNIKNNSLIFYKYNKVKSIIYIISLRNMPHYTCWNIEKYLPYLCLQAFWEGGVDHCGLTFRRFYPHSEHFLDMMDRKRKERQSMRRGFWLMIFHKPFAVTAALYNPTHKPRLSTADKHLSFRRWKKEILQFSPHICIIKAFRRY